MLVEFFTIPAVFVEMLVELVAIPAVFVEILVELVATPAVFVEMLVALVVMPPRELDTLTPLSKRSVPSLMLMSIESPFASVAHARSGQGECSVRALTVRGRFSHL